MPKVPSKTLSNVASTPASMSDIARAAGVSESTVSRALNNNKLIAEKTRKRIQEIAREMNYKINESARNLRLQRSHTVSVVINATESSGQPFSDPFMLDMIGSIAGALSQHNYDLLFSSRIMEQKDWHDYLLGSHRADGVIVIGQGTDDSPLRELQKHGDPIVAWGNKQDDTPYCTVGSNNFDGGKIATEHLIKLGRSEIVFLGDIAHPEIDARFQGYMAALTQASLETHEHHFGTAFSINSGYQRVSELLTDSKLGFDAIFAASDNIAMGAIRALQEHGYRVPEDVSVVGFDDIPIASIFTPPLTTVRQQIHAGGEALVHKVMALINKESASSAMLPTELVVRGSCGANPNYTPLDEAIAEAT
jgi:DNA-binding LacI/PurR family transcriptional regulator